MSLINKDGYLEKVEDGRKFHKIFFIFWRSCVAGWYDSLQYIFSDIIFLFDAYKKNHEKQVLRIFHFGPSVIFDISRFHSEKLGLQIFSARSFIWNNKKFQGYWKFACLFCLTTSTQNFPSQLISNHEVD